MVAVPPLRTSPPAWKAWRRFRSTSSPTTSACTQRQMVHYLQEHKGRVSVAKDSEMVLFEDDASAATMSENLRATGGCGICT